MTKEGRAPHGKRWETVFDYYGLSVSAEWIENAVSARNELEHESMIGGRAKWYGQGAPPSITHSMQRLINMLLVLMIVGRESILMLAPLFCEIANLESKPLTPQLLGIQEN